MSEYPKTVIIRNTEGGMVWQIYHVENVIEARLLSLGATKNGFHSVSLEEHQPNLEETFPNWREEVTFEGT